ncbi:hypothetical protein HJG60_011407 [Phyllostomus discolor]|uniref:Uncharacterized protein n=1 Tax=Phyllostomus discolor TaxID=89673 RepID=A0A834A4N0_9CHIR|nr:hypothetical protein HJG60_011407 [Phyllostomus discolor]
MSFHRSCPHKGLRATCQSSRCLASEATLGFILCIRPSCLCRSAPALVLSRVMAARTVLSPLATLSPATFCPRAVRAGLTGSCPPGRWPALARAVCALSVLRRRRSPLFSSRCWPGEGGGASESASREVTGPWSCRGSWLRGLCHPFAALLEMCTPPSQSGHLCPGGCGSVG